jgi:DNA-binding transcriptional regulator YiaG
MTGREARAIREGMRLSRRKVALELGTNESSVYRWEMRGDREVPRMYARALRDLLRERSQAGRERDRGNPELPNGTDG